MSESVTEITQKNTVDVAVLLTRVESLNKTVESNDRLREVRHTEVVQQIANVIALIKESNAGVKETLARRDSEVDKSFSSRDATLKEHGKDLEKLKKYAYGVMGIVFFMEVWHQIGK